MKSIVTFISIILAFLILIAPVANAKRFSNTFDNTVKVIEKTTVDTESEEEEEEEEEEVIPEEEDDN